MTRHIFIDNSNIFGGAQRAAGNLEQNAVWLSVRVYYRNLFQLLERNGDVATRVLAGSVPPGNDQLWENARQGGYDTDLLRRVENDDGRLVEQAVDEMLHLKIANALLDHQAPQTLVIASGDGRVSDWNTSFPGQAERALRHGWDVEVWSWQEQLTGAYARIARTHPGRVAINALDPYYHAITFVRRGQYNVNGLPVTVQERIVSRLR
jgi:NYN domain